MQSEKKKSGAVNLRSYATRFLRTSRPTFCRRNHVLFSCDCAKPLVLVKKCLSRSPRFGKNEYLAHVIASWKMLLFFFFCFIFRSDYCE